MSEIFPEVFEGVGTDAVKGRCHWFCSPEDLEQELPVDHYWCDFKVAQQLLPQTEVLGKDICKDSEIWAK